MTDASLDNWIHDAAIPFSPDTFIAAVDRLADSLDDSVELLGFGEALHGGEDILMLRNRLFQGLVMRHGYSAIAVESSFPRGRIINDYVMGSGRSSHRAIWETGFSHNFGQLEANRELVAWMRHINSELPHKIHFYGFDSPTESMGTDSPRHVLYFVLNYLDSVDGSSKRRERIDSLLGSDADWENPAVSMDPSKGVGLSDAATALRIETEDLTIELHIRRPELIARSDKDRYWEAWQYATVARQLLNYHAGLARDSENRLSDLLGIRDTMMADNLAYIVARERGKVLAFAHNSHLQYGTIQMQLGPYATQWWSAGAHLKHMLGSRYVVIGSAVGVSEANGIGQPEPDTLEARLTSLPGTGLFIPTRGIPASEIAALPIRSGSAKNPGYYPLNPQRLSDFDWLVVLHSTTYSRGGPSLP
jgi:erythromycin esterase